MPFVARLRQLRTQNGFSFHDLANRTGLRPTYLSQIEDGAEIPAYPTLEILAEGLEVPLYQLFYDEHPPETPWLTPRPSLEECVHEAIQPKTRPSLLDTVRSICEEVSTLLH